MHRFYIEEKKNGVSIIDSTCIPHCHTENALKKGQKQEMWLRFYMVENGVSIIDSIPHCHTENALKKGQKQEMWLRFYIVEKWSMYHR